MATKSRKPDKRRGLRVTDQVRGAIERSGQTEYALAKGAGVDRATLGRFLRGESGGNGETIDRVCDYLGLKLTEGRRGRAAAPSRRDDVVDVDAGPDAGDVAGDEP